MKLFDFLRKPVIAGVVGAVIGLILGLIWAWMIQPVKWKNISPAQMDLPYQEQYLRMVIDSYSVNGDNALALQRFQALGSSGPTILSTITSNPVNLNIDAISAFTNNIEPSAIVASPTEASKQKTGEALPMSGIAVILGAVILFALVGYGILRYLIPLFRTTRSSSPTGEPSVRDISGQSEVTGYETIGQDPPISQFVTTYALGDDLFDDSFSIDSPSGEFLGECGVGISETIGVGDPKKVQAFEVWLFDKNDIQTITKVLMSTHAFKDAATYQRLQAKGEPFMVESGKQIVMETAALQLVATVADAVYGQGALPEESYFDRLTLEIAVWPKSTAPAPAA